MAVPFGFSVGDFVTVLNLFKDIGVALRDQGGASSDFQKTLQHLTTVHGVLLQLEIFKSSTGDLTQTNAIRGQAKFIQHEVEQFLKKLEAYKGTLGGCGRKGFHHGTFSKIKWSQHVAGQVRTLCRSVETQLTSVHLLLDLHQNDTTSKIYNELFKLRDEVLQAGFRNARLIEDQDHDARREWHSVQQATISAQAQTTISVDELAKRISGLENVIRDRSKAKSPREILTATDQATNDMARLQLCMDRLNQSNTAVSNSIQESTAATKNLLELKDVLAGHLQGKQASPITTSVSDESARIMLTLTLPKFKISLNDLKNLLRRLSADLEAVLTFYLTSFLVCLGDFLLVLPQIITVWKILQRLPPTISLILHDNIRFEDALGRVQSLQYQQFKHWTVFEANLRCAFTNSPGMQKVLDGHFMLNTSLDGERLTPSNWTQRVRPGLEIQMSISLMPLQIIRGHCTLCSSRIRKGSEWETICSACALMISRIPESPLVQMVQVIVTASKDVVSTDGIGSSIDGFLNPLLSRRKMERSVSVPSDVVVPFSQSDRAWDDDEFYIERLKEIRDMEVFERVYYPRNHVRDNESIFRRRWNEIREMKAFKRVYFPQRRVRKPIRMRVH